MECERAVAAIHRPAYGAELVAFDAAFHTLHFAAQFATGRFSALSLPVGDGGGGGGGVGGRRGG